MPSALAANPNPMHPPVRGRPDAPDAEASVVSDCAEREAVTECKAVPERKAVVPIAERESITIPIAERKAIASITEREAIIAVAERAVELRVGRAGTRWPARAAADLS